ncbi:MAG: thioredoxin family protein [Saonia sp.]
MKIVQLSAIPVFFLIVQLHAQPYNVQVDTGENAPYLIGKINKEGLSQANYSEWFLKNERDYLPQSEIIAQLKNKLPEHTIKLFMGTWCGDSKREVPSFYKILNEIQFPLERLTNIAVDLKPEMYKQSPGGEQEGLNIHRVPTFIFYKNGKEINRIVERPVQSLEEDMLAILNENYSPNYSAVNEIDKALHEMGVEKFQIKSKQRISEWKKAISSFYELNTFSYVLLTSGKKQEAVAVATLNTELYPEDAKAYKALGNRLRACDRNKEALAQYELSLKLNPDDDELKSMLRALQEDPTD